jgi:hypothetical protein
MPYNLLIVYKSVFEAYFGGRGRRLCDICNFQRKVVCVALWNSAKLGDLRPQSRPFCDVPRLVFITPCIRSLKSTYMQDMFIFGFCCQEEHIYITDSKNSFLFWHFFLDIFRDQTLNSPQKPTKNYCTTRKSCWTMATSGNRK